MQIINASINSDLSVCAIEEGLIKLAPEDLTKVVLLASSNYNFNYIFNLFYIEARDKNNINAIDFKLTNIDTSSILATDSWMLIDYLTNTIYYNEGA